jgi:hypothetical protein
MHTDQNLGFDSNVKDQLLLNDFNQNQNLNFVD